MIKKSLFLLLLVLTACQPSNNFKNPVSDVASLGLVPKPQEVQLKKGAFLFDADMPFVIDSGVDNRIDGFVKKEFPHHKIIKNKYSFKGKGIVLSLIKSDTLLQKEMYLLDISPNGVLISADTSQGLFYGLQTLRQLFPDVMDDTKQDTLPALHIFDRPQFGWRGAHLDVSRHFFGMDFIKKYVDLLAKHKMNTFHWHLVDDQAWRIEIKSYPKLTKIGSVRKETVVKKHFKPFVGDGKAYGGYYTQDEIREVVAYARERYVNIIPEIEMPGHSLAALAAYPQYSCTGGPFEVGTKWGVFKDIYCAGNDSTFVFLENILDEVMDLFPSKYIHIGGDEAPKTRWKACAKCQQRIKQEHLKDEKALQSYFIKRIEKYVNSKGRQIIGWDEILQGGLAPKATVMSWRGEKGGIAAAQQNHSVIMTPMKPCYFDHYQSKDKDKEPFAIGGYNPLRAVYNYNPIPKELPANKRGHVLGSQANVWTEYMASTEQVEYMAYPRICALSEVLWTGSSRDSYDDFIQRLKRHFHRLDAWKVHYRHLTKEDE